MNSKDIPTSDQECFERVSQAIEKRVIKLSNVKTRLRVLSVHPALSSGKSNDEVTLRLVIRPAESSELLMVKGSSLEARLYEFGLTYPFSLKKDIEQQVDRLVATVEEEAPRALEESLDSNKQPTTFVFDAPIIDAALVTASVIGVASLPVLIYKGYLYEYLSLSIIGLLTLSIMRVIRAKR